MGPLKHRKLIKLVSSSSLSKIKKKTNWIIMKLPKVLIAIFAMHISLVRSNFLQQRYQISRERPSWATSISIPGQTIEADFRIAQFGGNPQNIPSVWHKNSLIFTLNHVLSWSQIYTKLGYLMQDWANTPNQQTETAVRLFIRKVFQIDNQAYVNPAFCSGYQNAGWNHQCTAVSHAGVLAKTVNGNGPKLGGECPKKIPFVAPTSSGTNAHFCGKALQAFEQIRMSGNSNIGKLSNKNNVKTILDNLFNAPANLRYGDSRTNSAIRDILDPMGKGSGRLTTKEKYWVSNIQDETVRVSDECRSTKSTTRFWDNCYMSSTGEKKVRNGQKEGYANNLYDVDLDLFQ